MVTKSLFFELIQISIGVRDCFSKVPTTQDWIYLYKFSQAQALVGVCFAGITVLFQHYPEQTNNLSAELKMKWLGESIQVQQRNALMNHYVIDTLTFFREKGFPCEILKGQGIALLYGNLSSYRQSGDIDIWLTGGREKIYSLSQDVLGTITGANYHHIHFPLYDEVEIEAHIYPSFLSSPIYNKRLHIFFKQYQPYDGCEDFPSLDFNRIFILLHCYRHLCGHGVGLRQLMDYYFVLIQGFTEEERKDTIHWCQMLGMTRFVSAVMWVMKSVFNLNDNFLLCEPNDTEGEFLLEEILKTGNMGHNDNRFNWAHKNALRRFLVSQNRNLHLVTHYPQEVCWSPVFNIIRFCWQKIRGI